MSAYVSKNQICNLALSRLGNNRTVSDIDTPTTDIETVFALHYDITRQHLLKKMLPNFALRRRRVAQEGENPDTEGYGFYYEYPVDCLKVLGIGEISDRANDYVIEADANGSLKIWTDDNADDGLLIRYVHDETVVSNFTTDFINVFSYELAGAVGMNVTQNPESVNAMRQMAVMQMNVSSGLNAQENRPVRVSQSRFKQSRYTDTTQYPIKK